MSKVSEKYIEGIGRRKRAVARVRLTPSNKNSVTINDKSINEHFLIKEEQDTALEALNTEGVGTYTVSIKVSGGGKSSQAESVRLGISRALVEENSEIRKDLKKQGFLKRDPRIVERKKFGKKKARKSPQWSKR